MKRKLTRLAAIFICLVVPASVFAAEPPAKPFDLSNWKLTLPVDTDHAGSPDEIQQPELESFVEPRHFFLNAEGSGIVFRAACGGSTTKGSKYPRCELREMSDGGRIRAAWDTAGQEMHTISMRVAITKTPRLRNMSYTATNS